MISGVRAISLVRPSMQQLSSLPKGLFPVKTRLSRRSIELAVVAGFQHFNAISKFPNKSLVVRLYSPILLYSAVHKTPSPHLVPGVLRILVNCLIGKFDHDAVESFHSRMHYRLYHTNSDSGVG